MNQNTLHRNKCQNCFRNVGKFILDCYCFLCIECFNKHRNSDQTKCIVCFKPTSGKFIDTRDQTNMSKVNYLFGDFQGALSRCTDIYRFQNDLDLRYIKYLENQLGKYKDLLNNIIVQNPRLKEYVNNFFKGKSAEPRKSKSVSERITKNPRATKNTRVAKKTDNGTTGRSKKNSSEPSIQKFHDQLVDPHPVKRGGQNLSAKVGYNVPSINYSTAVRSSKRPNQKRDIQQDEVFYYRR